MTKEDIAVLAAEFNGKPESEDETEGEEEVRDDPKMPRHMRPRGEGLFGDRIAAHSVADRADLFRHHRPFSTAPASLKSGLQTSNSSRPGVMVTP